MRLEFLQRCNYKRTELFSLGRVTQRHRNYLRSFFNCEGKKKSEGRLSEADAIGRKPDGNANDRGAKLEERHPEKNNAGRGKVQAGIGRKFPTEHVDTHKEEKKKNARIEEEEVEKEAIRYREINNGKWTAVPALPDVAAAGAGEGFPGSNRG